MRKVLIKTEWLHSALHVHSILSCLNWKRASVRKI